MARHDDADRAFVVLQPDGLKRPWESDLHSDFAAPLRLSVRDCQQRLPYLPLKRRPNEIQVKIELGPIAGEVRIELFDGFGERVVVGLPALVARLVSLIDHP